MKKLKKIVTILLTATTLSIGISGISSVSAATTADSYSSFSWSRNGTSGSVSLKNNSGASRYVQVSFVGYNTAGTYVGNLGNEGIVSQGNSKSKSGTINYASSMTFSGYLYAGTSPVGTPLSYWSKSV
jgi:hypothetical protein